MGPESTGPAALGVVRDANGAVVVEEAAFAGSGGTHGYAVYSGATVADVIAAMGLGGWLFGAVPEDATARPAADLVLMDWRRGRKIVGQETIEATVYVHGAIEEGGGD